MGRGLRARLVSTAAWVSATTLAPVIDTHCHLTFAEFAQRVPETLAEAAAAGVSGVITISTTPGDALEALAIAKQHQRVWCSAGVHPLYTDQGPHDWGVLALVAADARCVAWGELGLDNHYSDPPGDVQRAVLDEQLALIVACARGERGPTIDKPIVVHCREAFADLLPILKRSGLEPGRFVFHCFTGTVAEAKAVLDFGAMLSFTGVLTYANAPELREAARLAPADRLLVETDAPFLSPEPVRKKRPCVPAYVRHTAEALAAARGERFEEFHEQLNRNTSRFFGIEAR